MEDLKIGQKVIITMNKLEGKIIGIWADEYNNTKYYIRSVNSNGDIQEVWLPLNEISAISG